MLTTTAGTFIEVDGIVQPAPGLPLFAAAVDPPTAATDCLRICEDCARIEALRREGVMG
jgi:hypothetical protein